MPTIVICSSAAFYGQAVELAPKLNELGLEVVLPYNAQKALETGIPYSVKAKTWYTNPDDYHMKKDFMRRHFDEIAKDTCDAILVLNYEKHGVANYIGPNVLMEMGIAFYFHKPIYILNELPENSPFEEELKGFLPTILHGKLDQIPLS